MEAVSYVLAAIAVLVLLVVAVAFWRRQRAAAPAESFMPGDAAPPRLIEAVAAVHGDLVCIASVAAGLVFDKPGMAGVAAARGELAAGPEACQQHAEACQGLLGVAASVQRLEPLVAAMAPTYQNALGVYRGLRGSDEALRAVARALDEAGAALPAGAAAGQLRQMSACIGALVRSVHLLGAALQME